MQIRYRTMFGQACKPCALETAKEKRRITMRDKKQAQHVLAVEGRARRNAELGKGGPE